jgi:glutathione S-transferase
MLRLHYHPLSSFCWKVLIPLYENGTPFEPVFVDLGDEASRAAFLKVWPMGKFPVLEDTDRGEIVPESTIIIDYLDRYLPGAVRFTPADPDLAWRVRLWDRFFDLRVHEQMQRVVADRNRRTDQKDPFGVADARRQLANAYCVLESEAVSRTWFSGDAFGLADCAATPALYYANRVQPFGPEHPALKAYLDRLMARPSFVRVFEEAGPYLHYFPEE